MDGCQHTCDDLHAWLAPWQPGGVVDVELDLGANTRLGMVRIWNYNAVSSESAAEARLCSGASVADAAFAKKHLSAK